MVNGRVTVEQMEWLQERADHLGGNMSAALRQSITDARLFEMVRAEYSLLLEEHPGFRIPPHVEPPYGGRLLDWILRGTISEDADDIELRKLEAIGLAEPPGQIDG